MKNLKKKATTLLITAAIIMSIVPAMSVSACWLYYADLTELIHGGQTGQASQLIITGVTTGTRVERDVETINSSPSHFRTITVTTVEVTEVLLGNAKKGDIIEVYVYGVSRDNYLPGDWFSTVDGPFWDEDGLNFLFFIKERYGSERYFVGHPQFAQPIDDAGNGPYHFSASVAKVKELLALDTTECRCGRRYTGDACGNCPFWMDDDCVLDCQYTLSVLNGRCGECDRYQTIYDCADHGFVHGAICCDKPVKVLIPTKCERCGGEMLDVCTCRTERGDDCVVGECVIDFSGNGKFCNRCFMQGYNYTCRTHGLIYAYTCCRFSTTSYYQRGHVLGKENICTLDALEILKYIVGMETIIEDGNRAFNAARVTYGDVPTIDDVLEILKHIVGLPSRLDTWW